MKREGAIHVIDEEADMMDSIRTVVEEDNTQAFALYVRKLVRDEIQSSDQEPLPRRALKRQRKHRGSMLSSSISMSMLVGETYDPGIKTFESEKSDSVENGEEEDEEEWEPFGQDTFTLMMLSHPLTKSWILGFFVVSFQITLGLIVLIFQLGEGNESTPFNVPHRVDLVIRISEFLTIILCLCTQDDILTAIDSLQTFRYSRISEWRSIIYEDSITKDNEEEGDFTTDDETNSENGHQERSDCNLWLTRIVVPNFFKFVQGTLVTFISYVVVIQSDDIVELLKDYSALFVLSQVDNIFFAFAYRHYLGQELADSAIDASRKKIPSSLRSSTKSRLRNIVFCVLFFSMVGAWIYIVSGQVTGKFVALKWRGCVVGEPTRIGDDNCDNYGIYNTAICGFDGGDCIQFNMMYNGCNVVHPDVELSNGICTPAYDNIECRFDGLDCGNLVNCPVVLDPRFGDGSCNVEPFFNEEGCNFDHGDCFQYNLLTECWVDEPGLIGNGECDDISPYNTMRCNFDGGDCLVFNEQKKDCHDFPAIFVGDGHCDQLLNTTECEFDGGDCL